MLRRAGFTAVWLPCPLKGAAGSLSNGYDVFDDYDLGAKDQKGTVPTRYGSREQLARCVAMLRANGLDVYTDLVENQRDGDDGHFNFEYVDAFGQPSRGRFPKAPLDFHPNVPADPDVFSDRFSFGPDLAPIDGEPRYRLFGELLAAADWLTRSLDVQGFRVDNVKGVSTDFLVPLLNHGALAGKFAVGEFFDGNISLIQAWMNAVQHRAGAFDFPLRFMLATMCKDPGAFDMSSLDHAGLTGADPLGSVTFVENHDTDQSSPVVSNKMLGYAHILTAEGYPCVFYRDYSTDPNCYGLKAEIDPLIWVHENLANGPTQQRWKDPGVFAYERMGGNRLLVGLNKDPATARTISVQTGFPPHTQLQDFSGHAGTVTTDATSMVTIAIPPNANGGGYVCYSRPARMGAFPVEAIATTQDYEGASDLDIKPALENTPVTVGRIFVEAGAEITGELFFDISHWAENTTIRLQLLEESGAIAAQRVYSSTTPQGTALRFKATLKGFHAFVVQSSDTPSQNKAPSYRLRANYRAPQTF